MMAGITLTGFETKTLQEILAEIQSTEKSSENFGPAINVTAQETLGIINAIFSERESELWLLALALYNARRPSTAEGQALDDIGSISGVTRLQATYSTAIMLMTGVASTVVPAGTIFSVDTNPAAQFALDEDTVLIGLSAVAAGVTALETGPIVANSGTLTVIDTPVSGLTDAGNFLDADIGSDIETDADFRIRRSQNVNTSKSTTLDGIRASLLELNESIPAGENLIEQAIVYENDTDATVDSRPPNSIEVYVFQTGNGSGQDQLVADTLFLDAKPAGVQLVSTSNTVTKAVVASTGRSRSVVFSRPTEVAIYVDLTLTVTTGYPGDATVETAVAAWGNDLGIGQDIIVFGSSSLSGVLNGIAGITDYTILISRDAGPPTTDDNITIADIEFSSWDTINIDVSS